MMRGTEVSETEKEVIEKIRVCISVAVYLDSVAAGGGEGWGAVPAHHRVDGLHPGLQLLLVRRLEQVFSPVTSFQPENSLVSNMGI